MLFQVRRQGTPPFSPTMAALCALLAGAPAAYAQDTSGANPPAPQPEAAAPATPDQSARIPELESESTTTTELLQAHLPSSRVVKAFNHIYAAQLTTDGRPAGAANRRALAIAGDDRSANDTVAQLLDEFGFDAVDLGPLKESWRIQRDTPGYGPRRTAEELRTDLAAARRPTPAAGER